MATCRANVLNEEEICQIKRQYFQLSTPLWNLSISLFTGLQSPIKSTQRERYCLVQQTYHEKPCLNNHNL